MSRYKYINGIRYNLTAEEEAQRDAKELTYANGEFDRTISKLRNKRNNLLAETDWYANSDVTMSDAMTTYRQELRDITNGLTTVDEVNAVVFPNKPEE